MGLPVRALAGGLRGGGGSIVASTDSHDCADVGVYHHVRQVVGGTTAVARP